jgi:hypothetical protein
LSRNKVSAVVPVQCVQADFGKNLPGYVTDSPKKGSSMKTTIDFELIPYKEATAEEKNDLDKILRRGNKVLHAYHARVKEKLGKRYSSIKFRKELFAAAKKNPDRIEVRGIIISKSDFSLINQVKKQEFEVLMTYSRLIYKLADKWTKIDSSLSLEDYYN